MRFAGVGSVSIQAFSINLRVPDLSWNIEDFQTRCSFSWLANVRRFPCTWRFLAWFLSFSCTPALVAFLTLVRMSTLNLLVNCLECSEQKDSIKSFCEKHFYHATKLHSFSIIHLHFLRMNVKKGSYNVCFICTMCIKKPFEDKSIFRDYSKKYLPQKYIPWAWNVSVFVE